MCDRGGSVPNSTRVAFVTFVGEYVMTFMQIDKAPSVAGVSKRHLGLYTVFKVWHMNSKCDVDYLKNRELKIF